jgi:hypothetical protein
VIQENIEGDVIKFYSVLETDLFYWYYLNKKNQRSFDLMKLKELASESAGILKLFVFGGDAIIKDDGSIVIIDINDWPSFAPVREEAGKYISKLIYSKALDYVKD